MKILKASLFFAFILCILLGACKKEDASKKIVLWTSAPEVGGMIDNYFMPENPEMEVEYQIVTTEQINEKLLDKLRIGGDDAPDVFSIDSNNLKSFIESGFLMDLSDIYKDVKDSMFDYTIKAANYKDKNYAFSWQITPGAVFYRRSLAKKYLGTDDPVEVKNFFSIENIEQTAEKLYKESNGVCKIFASVEDLYRPFKAQRSSGWIKDKEIVFDPQIDNYIELAKKFYDSGYTTKSGRRSEEWIAGMKNTLTDSDGKPLEVFAYFLDPSEYRHMLKNAAKYGGTEGDWGMVQSPLPYYTGGTWLAVYKNTKNPNAAERMVRYFTSNEDFLLRYAVDSGDIINNRSVIQQSGADEFLSGQNPNAIFAEIAQTIKPADNQADERTFDIIFTQACNDYLQGTKTIEQAKNFFLTEAQKVIK